FPSPSECQRCSCPRAPAGAPVPLREYDTPSPPAAAPPRSPTRTKVPVCPIACPFRDFTASAAHRPSWSRRHTEDNEPPKIRSREQRHAQRANAIGTLGVPADASRGPRERPPAAPRPRSRRRHLGMGLLPALLRQTRLPQLRGRIAR